MIVTSYFFKRRERGTMEKISLDAPKTGSDLVLETLRDLGIDTIFEALLPISTKQKKKPQSDFF